MRVVFPSLLSLLLLTGCVSSPSAKVTDVVVEERTSQGTRLVVIVELTNPNATALPLPKADYEVSVDGAGSFSFQVIPDATLPGKGVQTIRFPAALAGGRSLAGRSYNVSGSIFYEPPGEVRRLLTEYRVPLPSAGFSKSGTLN